LAAELGQAQVLDVLGIVLMLQVILVIQGVRPVGCNYWTLRLLGVLVPSAACTLSTGSPESLESLHFAFWDNKLDCKHKKVIIISISLSGVQIGDDTP
jgi:hypothetical protein